MLFLRWDEHYHVFVDEQGIMVPTSTLLSLLPQLKEHLAHSPLELEAIGRHTVEERHPRAARQFNWDYFK